MDKYIFRSVICIVLYSITEQCMWDDGEQGNVVGQQLNRLSVNLTTCQQLCEENSECKSIDYGIEDGLDTCDINEVSKEDADSFDADQVDITHYICKTNDSDSEPPVRSDEDDSDGVITWDEFQDWVVDEPVYLAMIGMGLVILILVLVIIIALCCFVEKSYMPSKDEHEKETGLAPIKEEPEDDNANTKLYAGAFAPVTALPPLDEESVATQENPVYYSQDTTDHRIDDTHRDTFTEENEEQTPEHVQTEDATGSEPNRDSLPEPESAHEPDVSSSNTGGDFEGEIMAQQPQAASPIEEYETPVPSPPSPAPVPPPPPAIPNWA